MRIKEISISRLFGLFDHVVRMNLADRVTIIHGPNGFGKTTLLRLVDSLACGKYSEIRRIAFRDFELTFDDGQVLQVIRVDPPVRTEARVVIGAGLTISVSKDGKQINKTTLPAITPEMYDFPIAFVERAIPTLKRLARNQWRDSRTGEILGFEEVFRLYPHAFPISRTQTAAEPDWLKEFRKQIRVRFIESQRLLRVTKGEASSETDDPIRPAVNVYARELAKLLQNKLAEYATLSQSLDRSFPKRIVEQARTPERKKISVDSLRSKLQDLENRRASLTQAGLLDREPEDFDLASYLTDETLTTSVLPVYAQDAESKLKVFDDIAHKIELLTTIVNAHFQFKEMSIDKDKGFLFVTKYPGRNERPRSLSPANLSSGEQHMLVLLYELLFTIEPNSMIMIDEPEISLHVAWQLEFLSDIQKITSLTDIDVLIATHAPGIINDRMDLTVGLEGPGEQK